MAEDSVFTKIIKGEIPSHKIYEDDKTFAFLDIHPIQPGHVLVVTKAQVGQIWDLTDEDYQALWQTVRKIANKMRHVFPAKKRIGVMVEGLEVDHVHVKLFPINTGDEFRAKPSEAQADQTELADMAAKLKM